MKKPVVKRKMIDLQRAIIVKTLTPRRDVTKKTGAGSKNLE